MKFNNIKLLMIILATLIVVAFVVLGIWYFTQKSKSEIVEIRDFSCPGMDGFTFKYPVFKGWEVASIDAFTQRKGECSIFLKHPTNITFEVEPAILVAKKLRDSKALLPIPDQTYQNPKGVSYLIQNESYTFFGSGFYVDINPPHDGHGFSSDQFFKIVVDSFKITEGEAQAKRLTPAPVPPVSFEGVRYEVSGMAEVRAVDEKTNKEIWKRKIYDVLYDQNLEVDVQDVYITKMELANGVLTIMTEDKGKIYKVDVLTGKVTESTNITEIRDFSCSGMDGFTFKYPVFKGWSIDKIICNNNYHEINESGIILFKDINGLPIEVTVKKINHPTSVGPSVRKNDTVYTSKITSNMLSIFTDEFSVELSTIKKQSGFSTDQFFEMVIESFVITKYQQKIEIFKAEKIIGDIKIDKDHLTFNLEAGNEEFGSFLKKTLPTLEKRTLYLPTGGMKEDGTLWDGMIILKFGDELFMTALKYEIGEETEVKFKDYSFK